MKQGPYCTEQIQNAVIKARSGESELMIAPAQASEGEYPSLPVAVVRQEKVYYDDGQTVVTSRRTVLNGKTYAMANITSVALGPQREQGDSAFFILGLLVTLATAWEIFNVTTAIAGAWWGGICLVTFILATYFTPSPSYLVRIRSGSGETDALQGRERQSLQPIVDAINHAIVERQ
jgi:hypothetical protein